MIELKDVTMRFDVNTNGGAVTALENTNLTIGANEFVTVVGRSGCGKSTLLRLISGLLAPSSGELRINGALVDGPYKDVGFVFQAPVLLPWRTVLNNVLFPIDMLGEDVRKYKDRARELLHLSGLSEFENHHPGQLSGGMQQRVAICRALIHDPSLLLMDEPFGALDAMTRDDMSLHLLNIWESSPKTILFVTHSISEAVLLGDRVIVMTPRPGQVAKDIRIDIERPRDLASQHTDAFKAYEEEIRAVIYADREQIRSGK